MIRETAFVTFVLSVPVLALLGETNAFAAKAHSYKVAGEVTSTNLSDQTIVINRSGSKRGAELTLLVDPGSEILVGKEKKSLNDVHVGDRVRGKYIDKDGKHVARTLYVSSVPGSEKKSGAVGSTEAKQPPIVPAAHPASPATQPVTPGK